MFQYVLLTVDDIGPNSEIELDWGDTKGGTKETNITGPMPLSFSHTYDQEGLYVIKATASDQQGFIKVQDSLRWAD